MSTPIKSRRRARSEITIDDSESFDPFDINEITESTNQSNKKSTNQSTKQPIKQPDIRSLFSSSKKSINQSIEIDFNIETQPTKRSTKSTKPPVSQSTSQSISDFLINQSTNQSTNQLTNQSTNRRNTRRSPVVDDEPVTKKRKSQTDDEVNQSDDISTNKPNKSISQSINQSNGQSTNQSISQSKRRAVSKKVKSDSELESEPESPIKSPIKSKRKSAKQSVKSVNQSAKSIKSNQSMNQSDEEDESVNQSKRNPETKSTKSTKPKPSIYQSDDEDDQTNQSTNQSINQSTNQSTSRRTSRRSAPVNLKEESDSDFEDEPLEFYPSANPSNRQSVNQSTKQSISQSTNQSNKPIKSFTQSRKSINRSKKVNMKADVDPSSALSLVDAWREEYNSNQAINQPHRLIDLPELTGVKSEVLMMDNDNVQCQIEKQILSIYDSINQLLGFSFDVPVRSATNQLFVPELNRIVLKDKVTVRSFVSYKNTRKCAITLRILQCIYEMCMKQIHVTKRDLFYTDVKLFTNQADSDDVLDDVASMLACTRTSLNVVASEKGIVVGQISFRDDGDLIDCTKMGVGGKAIPPYIDRITEITGKARFILLVEKDAAFMRLAEDRFYNTYPCVIITGKGQPDVATRLFLKRVKETLKIPILGLVDSDPYGLKILSVFLSGSKNMSYDSASLTTPDVQWLGVRPSDLDRYQIPAQCRLPMTEMDLVTGKQMLQEDFILKNPDWHRELKWMVEHKEKAEIQALSNFGFQFLTQVYLPNKLREGDWI